jgi:hypothetical protein
MLAQARTLIFIADPSSEHVPRDSDAGSACPSWRQVANFNLRRCARSRRTQIVQPMELLHYQVAKIGRGRGAIVDAVKVVAGRKFENREKS